MALDGGQVAALLGAFLLVLLNGFFVAAEFALVRLRPTQVSELERRKDPRARPLRYMLRHLDAYLSTIQLGITAASLGLGWLGEPAVASLLEGPLSALGVTDPATVHGLAIGVAFAAITFAHVVVGELAPKSLAIRHPLETSRTLAPPLAAVYWLSWPVMRVFNGAALLLLRLFGIRPARPTETMLTEAELEEMLGGEAPSQVRAGVTRDILSNVFRLRRLKAHHVMTPRNRILALDLTRPLATGLDRARQAGYSRLPLVERSLDAIVGVVELKDAAFLPSDATPEAVKAIAQAALILPETASLDQGFRHLVEANQKLAIVVDEHGVTCGVVTIHDILEELVKGLDEPPEHPHFERLPDGGLLLRGDAPLVDLEEVLGVSPDDPDVATIGGLVTKRLGRSPRAGDRVRVGAWDVVVREATPRRVKTLVATRGGVAPAPSKG